MNNRAEYALTLRKKGYNCAQSVVCAYSELFGVDEKTAFKISEGFGGGMGGMQETCGAVTAMFMLAGLASKTTNLHSPNSKIETYKRVNDEVDLKHINDIISEKEVDTVVIGYPVNMDGSIGDRAKKAEEFAKKLENFCKIKVVLQDERLSTVSAQKLLINSDVRREKRKEVVDKIASAIILQTYLDTNRRL